MLISLFFSQRRHLQKTIAKLDTLKSEGFLQALKHEVNSVLMPTGPIFYVFRITGESNEGYGEVSR